MTEDTFCHGDYSYWANAVRMGPSGGSSETSKMFPEGWSTPDDQETRTSTIYSNGVAGLWLPLFIPEGCDGYVGATDPETGELLPEIIFYAANHVAGMMDQKFGPRSPENEAARWNDAKGMALEAAKSTSGSQYVREIQ